jgi:lipopolysaccharide export system permease protein
MSGLRVPLLISRFLPFSVLLGTLIAFTGLNQHSEVVAMKAAGMSAHQILAPMIVASLGVAGALFAFNETVVVKSRAHGQPPGATPTTSRSRPSSGVLSNVWVRDGDDLVRAGIVVGRGANASALEASPSTTASGGALASG